MTLQTHTSQKKGKRRRIEIWSSDGAGGPSGASIHSRSFIEAVLLVSRQGKTRLAKWYLAASLKEKTRLLREIKGLVLSRPPKQCNFIEFKDKKIVYKRYASLYFIACISKDENELITLESIHMFVEVLDRYFGNVAELDIIFNFHKAYYILDEMFIGGFQVESSKKEVLRICTAQEDYMDETKEEGFVRNPRMAR